MCSNLNRIKFVGIELKVNYNSNNKLFILCLSVFACVRVRVYVCVFIINVSNVR